MNGLDVSIFRAVNGWPDGGAPFWLFLSNATKQGAGIAALAVVFVALVAYKPSRTASLLALPSWLLSDATTNVLKYAFQWPRPCWPEIVAQYPEFHIRTEALTSYGTASAHSANMMCVATVFLWLYRPGGYAWFVVAVLTGLSRIYVGVHWPSQVAFGWFVGAFCGTLIVQCLLAYQRLRQKPVEAP